MLNILNNWTGWLIAGSLFFLTCIIIVAASRIYINAHLRKVGNNDDIEIHVRALFGLIRYHLKVPIIQINGQSIQFKKESSAKSAGISTAVKENEDEIDVERVKRMVDWVKALVQLTYDLKGIVRHSLARIELRSLKWSTTAGTSDAMWTAMATGLLWSAKTTITGLLSHMVQLQSTPQLTVDPAYNQTCFKTELICTARIRAGYGMLAAAQLFFRMKKNKQTFKLWRNVLFKPETG